jgi:molybdenum cofactor cytidylyltransferase
MASGFSRRFAPENKLLVPFRGKPLARHTLDLVLGMDCFAGIFFVAACDEVAALARGGPERLRVIRNGHPERGQRESIRLGVAAASGANGPSGGAASGEVPRQDGSAPAADYYMFFPCDQPLLDAGTVRRILDARRPGTIVQPCYRGKPGNPALFSAVFREALLALGEGEQGRDIIRRRPERLVRVEIALSGDPPFPDISPLTDIDDPGMLRRLETVRQSL